MDKGEIIEANVHRKLLDFDRLYVRSSKEQMLAANQRLGQTAQGKKIRKEPVIVTLDQFITTKRAPRGQLMFETIAQANHQLEADVIIGCSQAQIPSSAHLSITSALLQPLDWEYIFEVTRRNAVFPVVCWNLLKGFGDLLPGELKQRLDARFQAHAQTNMFLTGKMLSVVKLFNSNNIPVLPFKGPLLAQQAYGNLALRKYGDLDILVQPRHFEAAVELLKANDYLSGANIHWLTRTRWYFGPKKDIYLTNQERSVNLELHWKLSGAYFFPTEMHRLWERIETVDLAGVSVNTLSFNDLLIYLCLHGSKHGWERLGWICDVNELIRSQQNIDWELVFSKAKRFGCENVVALGLRLVHEFFGFNVPVPIWDKIRNDKTYDEIVAEIRGRLLSVEAKPVGMGERYLYHLKLKERPSDKWKLHYHYLSWYTRIILKPNEMDTNVLHFPRFLYPLYYVTRPIRLIYTSISRVFRADEMPVSPAHPKDR